MPGTAASPRSGSCRRGHARAARLGAVPALLGAVLALAVGPAGVARAEATQSAAAAGSHPVCQLTDPRLPEVSGLVVAGDKMLVVNDGGDRLTVYVLDQGCRVVDIRSSPVDPYDPEDLALSADGTLWICDTGDNLAERPTVALLALHPDGKTGVYRLTYPDGSHDAEALLLAPDGTPYVVTKDPLGHSGVYRPSAPLADGGTVAMTKVSALTFTPTGTPGGPAGAAGQLMVTGGAVSSDAKVIALRTYTDAYLWPLAGSDIPGALAAKPVRVPLPQEPQGEAISFGADGRQLVVAGEKLPSEVSVVPTPAGLVPAAATEAAGAAAAGRHAGVPTITAGVIAAVVATLAVWISGKLRRRRV